MIDLANIRKRSRKKKQEEEPGKPALDAPAEEKEKKTKVAIPGRKRSVKPKPSQPRTTEPGVEKPEPETEPEVIEETHSPSEEFFSSSTAEDLKEFQEMIPEESSDEIAYCLAFMIRREHCALPIEAILEIIPVLMITPVPNAPTHVMGIISLRGTVVPVIDLGMILGHKATKVTVDSKIIVLRKEEEYIGFIVDRVSRTLPIRLDTLEKPPVSGEKAGLLRGLYKHEKHIIMVMDEEKLL
ncbi:MAG TPA: chemotaxis protein CheW [Thermoanaerobaculia bacterium]|nr:chemotaxis protein CheW [Thermoanaerobaculia bacterium]HUM31150.1 chemotaxis protein CheW [Thermoanaerobaculia bacterium]HXK69506.1 chemotaxis protein CheW [Thermoanaerobaculia bacterium]